MAFTLSTGSAVSIAKTYAPTLTFSAASNDTECELTVVGSTIVAGDFVEVKSGWDLLDMRIVRAGVGSTATKLVLEGINTTNTSRFPVGAGTGSVRKITGFTQISQVQGIDTSGGEQNFADISTLANYEQRSIPTTRSPVNVTLTVFDDPNLPWVKDVIAADESRTPHGFLLVAANGSTLVANAYWSLRAVPSITQNEALTSTIELAFASSPMRYGV